MSNAQQEEMDAALDALEVEHDVDPIEPEAVEPEVIEEAEPEDQEEEVAAPKGYISYEDWIAKGKDPDDFKGKNAYSSEYERIQEVKSIREGMDKMTEGMKVWQEDQQAKTKREVDRARTDYKAELETAKENADVEAALEAQSKIDNLDKPASSPVGQNPVLTEFFSNNPLVDKGSAQFDKEFFDDCSMMQGTIMNQLTGGNPNAQLSDSQIKRTLSIAYEQAKALHPDKFRSPRNSRQKAPSQVKRPSSAPTSNYETRLKSLGASSRNKRDTSPALDMYHLIKESGGQAEADKFAKTQLGE